MNLTELAMVIEKELWQADLYCGSDQGVKKTSQIGVRMNFFSFYTYFRPKRVKKKYGLFYCFNYGMVYYGESTKKKRSALHIRLHHLLERSPASNYRRKKERSGDKEFARKKNPPGTKRKDSADVIPNSLSQRQIFHCSRYPRNNVLSLESLLPSPGRIRGHG